MDKDVILTKLNSIFQAVLEDDEISLSDQSTADDIDEWDSLNHMNLILEIENAFSVKFSNKQVADLQNIGDLIALISKKRES